MKHRFVLLAVAIVTCGVLAPRALSAHHGHQRFRDYSLTTLLSHSNSHTMQLGSTLFRWAWHNYLEDSSLAAQVVMNRDKTSCRSIRLSGGAVIQRNSGRRFPNPEIVILREGLSTVRFPIPERSVQRFPKVRLPTGRAFRVTVRATSFGSITWIYLNGIGNCKSPTGHG